MKQNTKKILAFSVLALFVFVFAMQFVAAEGDEVDILGPIGRWFADWTSGDLSANIAKYLFWALVSMMVYSVAGKIPGLSDIFTGTKAWLGAAFSIIVGFLSMAYITPEEVYTMMSGYGALGFVLGGALPFVILIFFTITLASESAEQNATQRLSTRILAMGMWILFTVFLFSRALGSSGKGNPWLEWILVALSVVITISMATIFKKVRDGLKEEKEQIAKNTADIQNLVLKVDRDRYEAMGEK